MFVSNTLTQLCVLAACQSRMHAHFVNFLDDALVKEEYFCLDSDMLRIGDDKVSHQGFVRFFLFVYLTGSALSTTLLNLMIHVKVVLSFMPWINLVNLLLKMLTFRLC